VRVEAGAEGGAVSLRVSDTGTGISAADLARLGRPFEQVEGAQNRTRQGTGLGLALVKALAALHGGEAVLESRLGEGTMVTVRLPHAAVAADGNAAGGRRQGGAIPRGVLGNPHRHRAGKVRIVAGWLRNRRKPFEPHLESRTAGRHGIQGAAVAEHVRQRHLSRHQDENLSLCQDTCITAPVVGSPCSRPSRYPAAWRLRLS